MKPPSSYHFAKFFSCHLDFSSELRDLESKLRDAYVAKAQLAQMAEKRALLYDQMVRCMQFIQAPILRNSSSDMF